MTDEAIRGEYEFLKVRQALSRGDAVVLPNPPPLTMVVAATAATAVNELKGRPRDQSVALWVHDSDTLARTGQVLDLDRSGLEILENLLIDERVTVLAPLAAAAAIPTWLAPASREGWVLLFGTRWAPVVPAIKAFPLLYVSSANTTGSLPAAAVTDAIAAFGATTPVLDVDRLLADRSAAADLPRQATTTVRIHPDRHLELHRHGAQDAAHSTPDSYIAALERKTRHQQARASRRAGTVLSG